MTASDRARGQVNTERNAGIADKAREDREGKKRDKGASSAPVSAKPVATPSVTSVTRSDRDRHGDRPREREQSAPIAVPVAATPAAPVTPAVTSTTGAGDQMTGYDQYTKAAMGASPAEAMQQAQAAAAQSAQMQSDAAVRQAVKGARTAGAMPGQAALAATGTAADAYGAAQTAGQQQYYDLTKLGASLGSEMSGRLATGEQTQAQKEMAAAQIAANAAESKKQRTSSTIGNIIGTVGGIASLFSDRNLKENIKPDQFTRGLEKLQGYAYKYKGNPRQEAGVMAQDLEKTPMKSAVIDTPKGKMLDTRRLSSMNTAALSEHEARLKNIERLVKELGNIPGPKGK